MHQSRKEQSIERAVRGLLHPDRREASAMNELESSMEAAEEWTSVDLRTGNVKRVR
ncbi:hypothetical protein D3C78_1182660 [compost metagenome]